MTALAAEPGFEHAIRYVMPDIDYNDFVKGLLSIDNIPDFQRICVGSFLEYLAKKTTAGITDDGMENIPDGQSYTFISNHRDIVLDASFLNLCCIRANKPITQIAIGNNLLIYDWIRNLVKINRCFIVKRDVKRLQALEAARQLSAYIHYVITCRNESVWIAQREGRAKDSNDVTQESVLKMMSLAGNGSIRDSLAELNIVPVAISYEYDPNDYLKVREFLLKRRDPEFKKSQRDDLFSMETGLMQFKGHVHFHIGKPVTDQLNTIEATDRNTIVATARQIIDTEIHRGYRIYPINYIAYDLLNDCHQFSDHYTQQQIDEVEAYWDKQTKLIDVPDITTDEKQFIRNMFATMYANPLKNQLAATQI